MRAAAEATNVPIMVNSCTGKVGCLCWPALRPMEAASLKVAIATSWRLCIGTCNIVFA